MSELAASAIPAERHLIEHASAEFFRTARHRLAAERAVELDRGLVLRKRPDDERFQRALRQIAARGGEQAPAEAEPLEFRPQVKLVKLAVIIQAARPVAPVIGIAGDLVAKLQQRNTAAFADRRVPPCRSAAVDQFFKFAARNNTLIGCPPRLIVGIRNRAGIVCLGAADFDQDGTHEAKLMMRSSWRGS